MDLQKFLSSFKYKKDGFDTWRIISKQPCEGDCDDFSITVSYLESKSSLLRMWFNIVTFRHRFYWCKSPSNEAHIILKTPKGWIDNIYPLWRDTNNGHTKVILYPWPFVVIKLILGKIFK